MQGLLVLMLASMSINGVKVEEFGAYQRGDKYGVARFVVFNDTDYPVREVELSCTDPKLGRFTKVIVWPPVSIPPHNRYRFPSVNIGLVSANTDDVRCEVTGVE